MAVLNANEIQKNKKGEAVGVAAACFCGAILAYFIICFTVAQVYDLYVLRLSTLIIAPVLMAAGVSVSAFCNLKYGGRTEKLVKEYIREVFVENASLMRPDRSSLTYYFSFDKTSVNVKINNFKETITFDFSAFGKLTAVRKASLSSAFTALLDSTFCRLYERGAAYTSVSYTVRTKNKQGKLVYIIENGTPDKKAYKNYLKNK